MVLFNRGRCRLQNEDWREFVANFENIDSLYRRAKQVCAHTHHNLRQSAGADDDYGRRHTNVYGTTFGTRCRSCSEDRGITVVNIYSHDEAKPRSPKHECKPVCKDYHREAGLPYWHIAEAAARAKDEEQKYNRRRAAEAWNNYFASICSEKEGELDHPLNLQEARRAQQERQGDVVEIKLAEKNKEDSRNPCKCMEDVCSHGGIYKCKGKIESCPIVTSDFESIEESSRSVRVQRSHLRYGKNKSELLLPQRTEVCSDRSTVSCLKYEKGNVAAAEEEVKCLGHLLDVKEENERRRNQSALPQIRRPFYGTTELEKSSLNAINHLLKAEKELRKVQFTAGSVIPKAQQYVEQVSTIHNDLKQFNTLFRELQKQTDEVLEQKSELEFTETLM